MRNLKIFATLLGLLLFADVAFSAGGSYVPYGITSGAAKSRIESALVTCSSGGSSLISQSSNWLASIATRSGGCCAITVASNVFASGSSPLCVATHSGTNTLAYFNVINATTINICGDNNGSVLNFSSYLMCQGTRP